MSCTPRRILLVDDDTANLDMLGELLRHEGHIVFCARNGAEAMACLRSAQPDILLLDYVMPTMDGISTIQALRTAGFSSEVLIVMTSGLPEDMVRSRGVHYDAFLQKPYTADEALNLLHRLPERLGSQA